MVNIWNEDIKPIIPFYNWDNKNIAEILLEQAIENYEPIEIEGKYGKSLYIEIKTPKEKNLFSIKSIKLRKGLLECSQKAKKYPIKLQIERLGYGKSMDYKVTIIQ